MSFSIILLEQDKFTKATIALDGEKWKYLWSIEEFIAEISTTEIYSKINCSHVEHPFPDYPTDRTVDVYFVIDDDNSTLAKERVKAQTEIKKLIELTEISLQAKLDENSLVSYFNFPVGLQGACEGYLLSFVEFLKEVGVDATAELKEDKTHPGQVLFSVTPGKGKDALGKVKQALDCYIEAATTTNFEFNPDASISALKFEAQVRHFQSQFALSQAQIRALEIENRGLDALARLQEATILSHQTTIENITANNVFLLAQVDSWRKGTAEKAKDEMRFLRGIVTLKEQRIGPFTLNAARFLYEMQQLMQDDGVPGNLREDVGLPALPPHDETKNY
ncbi:hypothetical protein EON83_00210 [bacterium]|nr:MAG: hypothetical protein EON83_00210 [bacterium]